MDLSSLKEAASNLTLYDLKAGMRKVQNAVMNYTEMEAKVREATNNEPWGASSSMMQEIANGTYNYQLLNEIMPMIYKRFTEKAADEWRQIYKALQLLEFLIKNGSERVIDDARSHLTLLRMLRQFHYIDQNGKDQGLNVRNRAKELADLLSDVERIRAERKKARATKSKYTGVEGGAGISNGSRFSGFGDESSSGYGGYSGGVYGDGGGFGGQQSDFQDAIAQKTSISGGQSRFEEYDEFTEGTAPAGRKQRGTSMSSTRRKTTERTSKKPEVTLKKEPEIDLFSFDDNESNTSPSKTTLISNTVDEEDDFDDFQSATPSVKTIAPTISHANSSNLQQGFFQSTFVANSGGLHGMMNFPPDPKAQAGRTALDSETPNSINIMAQPSNPTTFQGSQPNYFTSVKLPSKPTPNNPSSTVSTVNNSSCTRSDAFGSLWSDASAGIRKTSMPTSEPALHQLAKEKASAGIWGQTLPPSSVMPTSQKEKGYQGRDNSIGDLLG
ncbi:BgTH12-01642 [Blumeria graminis f. sp. triticale]|uniref:BgTH12-01642 n=1 Tax=Blumeria graminis f. sp. triticale TaxID=1689686 RepID=A0A9W4D4X6_BLUGR|nr:BgTH12-01642 [Blumeria graminis f. sp. triticale]